jgi:di/tripeptidase
VQAFLEQFAQEHGLVTKSDAAGNMVICRPGSGGGEHAPPVVMQGHIDMVTLCNSNSNTLTLPVRGASRQAAATALLPTYHMAKSRARFSGVRC